MATMQIQKLSALYLMIQAISANKVMRKRIINAAGHPNEVLKSAKASVKLAAGSRILRQVIALPEEALKSAQVVPMRGNGSNTMRKLAINATSHSKESLQPVEQSTTRVSGKKNARNALGTAEEAGESAQDYTMRTRGNNVVHRVPSLPANASTFAQDSIMRASTNNMVRKVVGLPEEALQNVRGIPTRASENTMLQKAAIIASGFAGWVMKFAQLSTTHASGKSMLRTIVGLPGEALKSPQESTSRANGHTMVRKVSGLREKALKSVHNSTVRASGNAMVRKVSINAAGLPEESLKPAQVSTTHTSRKSMVRKVVGHSGEALEFAQESMMHAGRHDIVRKVRGIPKQLLNSVQSNTMRENRNTMVRKVAINAAGFPEDFAKSAQDSKMRVSGNAEERSPAMELENGVMPMVAIKATTHAESASVRSVVKRESRVRTAQVEAFGFESNLSSNRVSGWRPQPTPRSLPTFGPTWAAGCGYLIKFKVLVFLIRPILCGVTVVVTLMLYVSLSPRTGDTGALAQAFSHMRMMNFMCCFAFGVVLPDSYQLSAQLEISEGESVLTVGVRQFSCIPGFALMYVIISVYPDFLRTGVRFTLSLVALGLIFGVSLYLAAIWASTWRQGDTSICWMLWICSRAATGFFYGLGEQFIFASFPRMVPKEQQLAAATEMHIAALCGLGIGPLYPSITQAFYGFSAAGSSGVFVAVLALGLVGTLIICFVKVISRPSSPAEAHPESEHSKHADTFDGQRAFLSACIFLVGLRCGLVSGLEVFKAIMPEKGSHWIHALIGLGWALVFFVFLLLKEIIINCETKLSDTSRFRWVSFLFMCVCFIVYLASKRELLPECSTGCFGPIFGDLVVFPFIYITESIVRGYANRYATPTGVFTINSMSLLYLLIANTCGVYGPWTSRFIVEATKQTGYAASQFCIVIVCIIAFEVGRLPD